MGCESGAGPVSFSFSILLVPIPQILGSLGLGGAIGATIAKKMAITDLPQMVRLCSACTYQLLLAVARLPLHHASHVLHACAHALYPALPCAPQTLLHPTRWLPSTPWWAWPP